MRHAFTVRIQYEYASSSLATNRVPSRQRKAKCSALVPLSSSHNDQLRSTLRISLRNPPSLVLERNWWIRKCLPTPLTLQCECCRIGHEDRITACGPYQLCSN